MTITFPTLLCSRAPYKNNKNTRGLDYVIKTRLLRVFGKTKSGHFRNVIFGVFFDVKGLR